MRSPAVAAIQLVLDCNEETVNLGSTLNEQQGFCAARRSDQIEFDACVRFIDGSESQIRLKEGPAGENLRNGVCEACSPHGVMHELSRFAERHGHDCLRDVPRRDRPYEKLLPIRLSTLPPMLAAG